MPDAQQQTANSFGMIDRRSDADRRNRSTSPLSRHSHSGGRRNARRMDDHTRGGYYIDWYEPKLLLTILGILILCLADSYMTLKIIASGGEELNVVMELLISESIFVFILGKYLMTSGSLIFLVAHRNFKVFHHRFTVSHILPVLLMIYIVLIAYEIHILHFYNIFPLM